MLCFFHYLIFKNSFGLFVCLFVCLFNRSRHNPVHRVHNRSIHGQRIHHIHHSIHQDRIRRRRGDRSIRSRGQRDQPQPQGQPHASCGHQSQRPPLRQQGRQQGGGGGVHIRSHIRIRRERHRQQGLSQQRRHQE